MDNIIVTNLITAISTLLAAFITGFFIYKSNLKKEEFKRLKNFNYKYLLEIKSFYELEKLYLAELSNITKQTELSLKKKIRKLLKRKSTMTTNDIDNILNRFYKDYIND